MDTTGHAGQTIVPKYEDVEKYLDRHAGPGTHQLSELTAAHGGTETEIRLDPDNRVIWWAYDNAPLGGGGWTVQRLSPEEAARDADPQADLAEDRIEAGDYEHETSTREEDEDLLDEYVQILALGLPREPRAARAQIARHREIAARLARRWQRADVELVRALVGTERGGPARAARQLGVSQTQVRRILDSAALRR